VKEVLFVWRKVRNLKKRRKRSLPLKSGRKKKEKERIAGRERSREMTKEKAFQEEDVRSEKMSKKC
jgi:hypothetical protein